VFPSWQEGPIYFLVEGEQKNSDNTFGLAVSQENADFSGREQIHFDYYSWLALHLRN